MHALFRDIANAIAIAGAVCAGGNLAAQMVAQAAPDGLTILAAGDTTFTVSPFLFKQLP